MAYLNRRTTDVAAIRRIHSEVTSGESHLDRFEAEQRLTSVEGHFRGFVEAHQELVGAALAEELQAHNELVKSGDNGRGSRLKVATTAGVRDRFCDLRLDPLSVPTFDGRLQNWLAFKDTFEALVHQQDYLEAYKLGKLRQAINPVVVPLVGGLYSGGYAEVWSALQNRYDNPRQLAEIHVSRFLNMAEQPSESYSSLLTVVDTVRESLRALHVMKLPVTAWDAITVPIVTSKLPFATQRAWGMTLTSSCIPELEELLRFLEKRAQTIASGTDTGRYQTDGPKTSAVSYRERHSLPNYPHRAVVAHTTTLTSERCGICQGNHAVFQCPTFRQWTPGERFSRLRNTKLCFNCLKPGHEKQQCPSGNCRQCSGKHNTLLCRSTVPTSSAVRPESAGGVMARNSEYSTAGRRDMTIAPSNFMASCATPNNSLTLLATAQIYITDGRGNRVKTRALCDPGFQASFMTGALVQRMSLPRRRYVIAVDGVGNTKSTFTRGAVTSTVSWIHDERARISLDALIIPTITTTIPNFPIDSTGWSHLRGIDLADPTYDVPGPIEVLLGADLWGTLLEEGVIHGTSFEPHAQATRLRWVVFGPTGRLLSSLESFDTHTIRCDRDDRLDHLIQQFWSWEETGAPTSTCAMDPCETIYQDSYRREKDGHYVVQIPFNAQAVPLGDSYPMAERQFLQLERKLLSDPELREKYINFMREYRLMGHMEPVQEIRNEPSHQYFIPHHAVSQKFRVVFNASAKTTNGLSLNDVQLVGPTLQSSLTILIFRFRRYRVPVTADVEKTFRRISIDKRHRRWQRILWREFPELRLKVMELCTVTYGMASSPFNAIRTLQQCVVDNHSVIPDHIHGERTLQSILEDFYVDHYLTSADTPQQAIELARDVARVLQAGQFHLRKWNSSDASVLCALLGRDLPEEELTFNTPVTTILGFHWNPSSDVLFFKVSKLPESITATKRTVLSEMARLYDPTGLLAPVIVIAKILIQHLWLAGLSWDASLPTDLSVRWQTFRNALIHLNQVEIPRWLGMQSKQPSTLHGFCDASLKAYAAVVYVRTVDEQGIAHVTLVTAKTRVAPIKTQTVPRLELAAAQLLVKTINGVRTAISMTEATYTLYTDSTIVLCWLRKHPSTLKPYVSNRVVYIQEHSDPSVWQHVRSDQNPADCASRGLQESELQQHRLWWNGSAFLEQVSISHPDHHPILNSAEAVQFYREERTTAVRCAAATHNPTLTTRRAQDGASIPLVERFSRLSRLLHTTAYVLRWLPSHRQFWHQRTITIENLQEALIFHIRAQQAVYFQKEITMLRAHSGIEQSSKLISLNRFLDEMGILRMGGRIQMAIVDEDQRHPIMCRPFAATGVDYCGPFLIRTGNKRSKTTVKTYAAIFVCMSTKAVHIELADNLSERAFLNVFARFISRRGPCHDLYSDNGTAFVGANHIMKRNLEEWHCATNRQHLVDGQTRWHFITPSAPHQGGLWKAAVKSAKRHLIRVVGTQSLYYEDLHTLLVRIEACLNSRPLVALSDDPDDRLALSPGDLLIGKPLISVPEPPIPSTLPTNRLKQWEYLRGLHQTFWRRWSQEYLSTLQTRGKWQVPTANIKIGDAVLITHENLPPTLWRLGRINAVYPGSDGLIRNVTVKHAGGECQRAIQKLCLLPCTSNFPETAVSAGEDVRD